MLLTRSSNMLSLNPVIHQIALPCKHLDGLVSHFWYSRWSRGVQTHFCYYSTANTNAELAFAFGWRMIFHYPKNSFSVGLRDFPVSIQNCIQELSGLKPLCSAVVISIATQI